MLKQCTKCGEFKEEEEFSWKNKAQGKRHSQCKECRRKADNERYANDAQRRENIKERHKENRQFLKDYIRHLKEESKCSICGESRWYCLDFHHIKDKKFTISQKIQDGTSLTTLQEEISKCIILCANCHRELHYKQGELE